MNRRRFLQSLGIGVAALYLRLAPECVAEVGRAHQELTAWWGQSTRLTNVYRADYLAVLERILAGHDVQAYLEGFKRA